MNEGSDQRWLMAWAGMTAASLVTLVISIVIVRSLVEDEPVVRRGSVVASDEKPIDAGVASLRAGVYGRVTAGGITSDVVLPAMARTRALDEHRSDGHGSAADRLGATARAGAEFGGADFPPRGGRGTLSGVSAPRPSPESA